MCCHNRERPRHIAGALHNGPRIYKPDPVPACRHAGLRHLSGTHLTMGLDQPTRRDRTGRPLSPCGDAPAYLAFQPVGFTKLPRSHGALVGSYFERRSAYPARRRAHLFIFTRRSLGEGGPCQNFSLGPCGLQATSLSAALSITPPSPAAPLPVRKHGALCCPDFPPLPERQERRSDARDVKERKQSTGDQ